MRVPSGDLLRTRSAATPAFLLYARPQAEHVLATSEKPPALKAITKYMYTDALALRQYL